MRDLKVAVIGSGISGILAAEKMLGSTAFNAHLDMFEKSRFFGGIPRNYQDVAPNSPYKDLYQFLKDLKAEGIFSEGGNLEALDILKSGQEAPSLGQIQRATELIYEDLLGPDDRFRLKYRCAVESVSETDSDGFKVDFKEDGNWDETRYYDVVISAVGAELRKFPHEDKFRKVVGLEDALDSRYNSFEGDKVVIAGASHSGAIALINAVNDGAAEIEVWYKGEKFREHFVDSNNIKHYQFSGVNDPTLSKMKEAIARLNGNLNFVDVENMEEVGTKYRDWSVVSAIGVERPPFEFRKLNGESGEPSKILQGDHFGAEAPNLLYPGTDEPIPRAYGLGLAYPLTFTEGFLENSVEAPNAKVVGIYFTNQLASKIIPDILKNWPEYKND